MKLCKNYPQDNPVVVLFAYSKLLTMDEKSLNLVLEEDEVKELESVRSVFEKRNIDYKLIKIGAPLIIPLSDSFESRFKSLLKGYKGAEKSSAQAVEIALKSVSSSFNKSFRSGNSLDDVINYQKELKDIKSGMPVDLGEEVGAPDKSNDEKQSPSEKSLKKQVLEALDISDNSSMEEIREVVDSLAKEFGSDDEEVLEYLSQNKMSYILFEQRTILT